MLNYPLRITPDGDGFLASFRDIPEALTGAETREETLELAHDALITAMEFYFEDNRTVPMPSKAQKDELLVEVPASVAAKILFLNEMVAQKIRPIELAKKMHVERQEVARILDLKYGSKIDTLSNAFKAIGKRLEVSVS